MRLSTIRVLAILAILAPATQGLAAARSSAPIAPSRLTTYCQGKAVSNFNRRASGINVMGAVQTLDNTWVAVGTAAVGRGERDFMCTYDAQRRFVELKRLD